MIRKEEQLLSQVRAHCPDLAWRHSQLNQEGQYNDILILDQAWVFRFARNAPAAATLRHEQQLLTQIGARLPLPTPQPSYAYLSPAAGEQAFVGYPYISGEPLWLERFAAIQNETIYTRLAADLAGFLQALHAIPPADLGLSTDTFAEAEPEWRDLYQRIEQKLFVYMNPQAQAAVAAHFGDYFQNPARYAFTPAVRHGDFGSGNILFDPKTGTISGILDFAFTGVGDPAVDFAGLQRFGPEFYRQCASHYPAMLTAEVRIDFYGGTFALQEALFGLEHDDPAAFAAGIETYR
ncbi:MAG: phosphotransferase [Anaerolineales bacterium]|nr:phosphotransferase [Anaerolineales bacterium]